MFLRRLAERSLWALKLRLQLELVCKPGVMSSKLTGVSGGRFKRFPVNELISWLTFGHTCTLTQRMFDQQVALQRCDRTDLCHRLTGLGVVENNGAASGLGL